MNPLTPFGLRHKPYTATLASFAAESPQDFPARTRPNAATQQGYKYQYQGQELQDELGLNWSSFKWRNYDPAIARWVAQDPVTHHSMSPYNAFDNNPIFWADPSGADGWSPNPMNADAFYGFAAEQQASVGLEGTSFVLNQTARMGLLTGDPTTGLSGMNPNAAKHSDGYFTYTSKTDHSTRAVLRGVPQTGLGTLAIEAQWNSIHAADFRRTTWDWKHPRTNVAILTQGEYGFWQKASDSQNYVYSTGYNILNDAYVTLQGLSFGMIGQNHTNPLTGQSAFDNLDGTANYNPLLGFANTATLLVPTARTTISPIKNGIGFIGVKAKAGAPHFFKPLRGVYVNKITEKIVNKAINYWNTNIPGGMGALKVTKLKE